MVQDAGERGEAGKVERDGGRKVGAPTVNGDEDKDVIFSIKRRVEDVPNAPGITATRPLQHPPLPTLSHFNIMLSRFTQDPYPPQIHTSPII